MQTICSLRVGTFALAAVAVWLPGCPSFDRGDYALRGSVGDAGQGGPKDASSGGARGTSDSSSTSGGSRASGGMSGAGGTTTGGSGDAASGVGGTSAAGGSSVTGGAPGLGGAQSSGGSAGNGGSDTGGASGTGGTGGSTSTGSGPIGALGQSCSPDGSYACTGHATRAQLVCNGGKWAANGGCPSGNNCDTSAGNVGFCSAILPECEGKQPGYEFCSGQDVRQCGPDLVTSTVAKACAAQACLNGTCTGVCAPSSTQCSGNATQTCNASGQWGATTPCPYESSGIAFAAPCPNGVLEYAMTCNAGACVSHTSDSNQNCWYCCTYPGSLSGSGCAKVNVQTCL